MRKILMIIAGFAVVGLAAVGGSAFTGTGVTSNAGATQYLGGTVNQSVTGATLSSIVYTFADTTNTGVQSVLLTFADGSADTKVPTAVFTGGNAVTFTCSAISADAHISTCSTPTTPRTGVTSLAITV